MFLSLKSVRDQILQLSSANNIECKWHCWYILLVVMTAMLLCWEKQFPTFFVWIALCANLIELDAPPTAAPSAAPIVAFVGQSNNHTS